jgi:1,4-alpha-glucan branching enzyme
MAALEGMSMGCPMVVSRVGGLKEMFEHQRNGLQFQPGDADDLASQLQLLIKHPALAQRLGHQAAQDCAQRYNPDAVARRTLELYRPLIAQRKTASRPAPAMEAAR